MGQLEIVVKLLAHNKQFKVNYKVLTIFAIKMKSQNILEIKTAFKS